MFEGLTGRLGDIFDRLTRRGALNEEDVSAVEFDLMIDPEHWGEGAEEALLAVVEEEARNRGLQTIQSWTLHRPDTSGPRLTPPTG